MVAQIDGLLCALVADRWRRRTTVVGMYALVALNGAAIALLPMMWHWVSFSASFFTVTAIVALARIRANGAPCRRDERDRELRARATTLAYRATLVGLAVFILGVTVLNECTDLAVKHATYVTGLVELTGTLLFLVTATLPNAIVAWLEADPFVDETDATMTYPTPRLLRE